METILSPKYQLLVPKNIRKGLNLSKGQKFYVISKEGIIFYIPDKPLKEIKKLLKGMDTKNIREEKDRL
ncbi:MAG: AbrB family transcriptional regulator [Cyanobacteria bacterium]|nr:AbrB family transcriptional regulator [Cyanobacteriota bacterium]